ncbi:TetR/AcrR family transcriptional regulator [Prosthecomicrobium pneumaticum]|uniref:AcrR family transcriptional regulator n=1 Tax=Prosthecomicrobium pneumaticum TaxID=81895 RepID=A0A7W9FKB5_9HYPH|nr:TetR/AcrR family transcriptional regulator [Prosthecomicrobium pneumaticum]MBB5752471.1 AcrR family transcriptional regulator [Prosthecomicrobium pneumaticum]
MSEPERDGTGEEEEAGRRRSVGARRSAESAEAILEAAADVLREKGYAGFSIEAVARRARAGKPTIYRWWPSKAALLLDVYQRQKRVEEPDTGALEEDLFLFLRSLLRHWRDTASGPIFRSTIAEAQSDPASAAALAAFTQDRRVQTGRIIARARARGELAADVDPQQAAELVAAYAWLHLLIGDLDLADEAIRTAVRHLAGSWTLPAR